MAETQTESSPLESQDLPTPEFSDKGDSSTSQGADEIVSKLLAKLEPLIEKKVQSQKDKRFSEIEKVLGGRSKILAELESEGVAIPKEVRTQMQIRELEERLSQQPSQPAPERVDGSTSQRAATTEAIAELQKYELDPNDAEFLGLLRGRYRNRSEFDLAVQKHIVNKLAPKPTASPAGVVQPPVTAGAADKSKEALKSDYIKEMQAARGNKEQGKAIQRKYREQGFDPGSVDFRL